MPEACALHWPTVFMFCSLLKPTLISFRYMYRCVLLPCSGASSPVELDVLDRILTKVGAAFSEALTVIVFG